MEKRLETMPGRCAAPLGDGDEPDGGQRRHRSQNSDGAASMARTPSDHPDTITTSEVLAV
jgi:hypothetical protein